MKMLKQIQFTFVLFGQMLKTYWKYLIPNLKHIGETPQYEDEPSNTEEARKQRRALLQQMLAQDPLDQEIPIEYAVEAVEQYGQDSPFGQALMACSIWEKLGFTPMILTNKNQTLMKVTCRETYGKLLH